MKDKDIREPLFEYLEEQYGKVRILEEKTMGRSRADVVMICDDFICGIEIKSDSDTYTRLERQVKDYDLYFEYNIVAVGASHGEHIAEHVPDWWGIITVEEVEGKADIYCLRKPQINPRVKRYYNALIKRQLSFLWRPELTVLMTKNGFPRYPGKSKKYIIDYLAQNVEEDVLLKQICETLFERDYVKMLEEINAFREAHGKRPKSDKPKRRRRSRRKV